MECYYLSQSYPNGSTAAQNGTVPEPYIVQAAVISMLLPLSFVGMVLNIVFIYCRKKTKFL